MRILLDSNILLRLADPQSDHHKAAFDAVTRLRKQGHELRSVPQNLYEFWVVATRPLEKNGLGLSVEETDNHLNQIRRYIPLLRDERSIFELWQQLVVDHLVLGKNAHDTRLVAAMHRHNLKHLLTFNKQDFGRFSDIAVLTPSEVLAE